MIEGHDYHLKPLNISITIPRSINCEHGLIQLIHCPEAIIKFSGFCVFRYFKTKFYNIQLYVSKISCKLLLSLALWAAQKLGLQMITKKSKLIQTCILPTTEINLFKKSVSITVFREIFWGQTSDPRHFTPRSNNIF